MYFWGLQRFKHFDNIECNNIIITSTPGGIMFFAHIAILKYRTTKFTPASFLLQIIHCDISPFVKLLIAKNLHYDPMPSYVLSNQA